MTSPQVSIVMTNHNYGKYLEESLQSVLDQDFQDYELIVVDDGSTDQSRELIEKWSARFAGRMRFVFQPHLGVGPAENAGLELAKGEYIAFLDADDIWMPS